MGLAMGGAVRNALADGGVTIAGMRWLWYPGLKGGTFEGHLARNNSVVFNDGEGWYGDDVMTLGAMPGFGVNGAYCMCQVRWLLRDANGRFLPERLADLP